MIDTFGGTIKNKSADSPEIQELSEKMTAKIFAAAQPGAVFSAPVVSGPYTIITASEVAAGGVFGSGSGSGSTRAPGASTASREAPGATSGGGGGGGGGGGSSARPVAAIVIGPDGVKVEPIVDASKIALAAIGAWLSITLLLVRRSRSR